MTLSLHTRRQPRMAVVRPIPMIEMGADMTMPCGFATVIEEFES